MSDRLYRSRRDRMLAGVAGGLAEMWDADPSLVRIVWALLVIFTGGLALLVYIVMAVVVPEEDDWAASGAPWPATTPGDPVTPPAPTGTGPDAQAWAAADAQARSDRAAHRAARRAARREGGGAGNGALIGGLLLILLGSFFLLREFLPTIDFDWFWPLVLVGLGVILLVSAVGRGRDRDRPRDQPQDADPGGSS